jgi:hypothetical protein
MISPYLFLFCDDISIPTGGQKLKDIAQTIFGQKIFKMEEFAACGTQVKLLVCSEVIVFESTQLHIVVVADVIKTCQL